MAEEIKREIWLLQRRRIPPIDIAEGSQIPIALTLMDYTIPAGATAKAYARPWDRETTYQQTATVDGNTVRFTPPDGFFRAGGNALQIEINGNKIPLLLDVNCGPRLSNGGEGATPEAVRPLVDRAEEAADAAEKSAQGIRDSAEKIDRNAADVDRLKEDFADYLHIDSDNIFDPSKATNKYIDSDGVEHDSLKYILSEYIPVPFSGDNFLYFNKESVSTEYSDFKGVHNIVIYDADKAFIKSIPCIGSHYGAFNQSNAKYMRLLIGKNTGNLMVVVSSKYDSTFFPAYIPYGGVYADPLKKEVKSIFDDCQENNTEKPLEHIIRDGGFTRIFRVAGVVGDSLSSGCMEYKGSSGNAIGYDRYEFSWIQQMRGICGFDKAENFSVGGLTSKTFWTTQSQKVKNLREDGANHKCQLYFIALGVNDIADTTMEVGTPNDISNESSTTFYGYYSRIIKLIQNQQPKARIFLVGLPNHSNMTKWGTRFRNFRDAIADMVNHFNFVYYLDLYQYELPYDSEFQKIYFNGFHENALGYARTAWVISSYVDWYIRHNYEEFRETGFIGTDYHYYE